MRYDYLVPGVLLMRTREPSARRGGAFRYGEPKGEPIHATFTSQAVTGMTDDTSRYFYSWGPRAARRRTTRRCRT